jgi:hypothetical protein
MLQRTRAMAAELHAGAPDEARTTRSGLRRHVRVEVRLPVGFSVVGEPLGTLTRAVTRDISHGGACLAVAGCPYRLREHLARLPQLDITIYTARAAADTPGEPTLPSFHGRIEWMRQPAAPGAPLLVGLAFSNLDALAEIAIIDLIAHLLLDAGAPCLPHAARPGDPAA